jgi:V/A-type H+-transporting ATPase subunit B
VPAIGQAETHSPHSMQSSSLTYRSRTSRVEVSLARMRGQQIGSVAGLPHLELAAQIAAQSTAGSEPFSLVFAAMGLTHTDAAAVRVTLEERSVAGELLLLINTADDPVIERILTPRIALTVAEKLAFEHGRHVLVVLVVHDQLCRGPARGVRRPRRKPGRRAYPGYLYSDLASLYERRGRIRGRPGSVTLSCPC